MPPENQQDVQNELECTGVEIPCLNITTMTSHSCKHQKFPCHDVTYLIFNSEFLHAFWHDTHYGLMVLTLCSTVLVRWPSWCHHELHRSKQQLNHTNNYLQH